eukprot:scaffold769_cov105-Isochrysis_galbana.AAC.6
MKISRKRSSSLRKSASSLLTCSVASTDRRRTPGTPSCTLPSAAPLGKQSDEMPASCSSRHECTIISIELTVSFTFGWAMPARTYPSSSSSHSANLVMASAIPRREREGKPHNRRKTRSKGR